MPTYTQVGPDVLAMAREVIGSHHKELLDARIGFIFQDTASKRLGKTVLGNTALVSDKQRAAGLDLDYIITLAEDEWEFLTSAQRMALLDHELCHCDYSIGEASVRGHDIEEFNCIIERHGLWNLGLCATANAIAEAQQLKLDLEIPPRGSVEAIAPELAGL
jgi:hypothetical protein